MSVLRPRNRLVNFRLTEEEYENLKAVCSVKGARSISDFARSAVMHAVHLGEELEDPVQQRLLHLGRKVSELESRFDILLKLLEKPARRGLQSYQSS
jgi:hypothetical protein